MAQGHKEGDTGVSNEVQATPKSGVLTSIVVDNRDLVGVAAGSAQERGKLGTLTGVLGVPTIGVLTKNLVNSRHQEIPVAGLALMKREADRGGKRQIVGEERQSWFSRGESPEALLETKEALRLKFYWQQCQKKKKPGTEVAGSRKRITIGEERLTREEHMPSLRLTQAYQLLPHSSNFGGKTSSKKKHVSTQQQFVHVQLPQLHKLQTMRVGFDVNRPLIVVLTINELSLFMLFDLSLSIAGYARHCRYRSRGKKSKSVGSTKPPEHFWPRNNSFGFQALLTEQKGYASGIEPRESGGRHSRSKSRIRIGDVHKAMKPEGDPEPLRAVWEEMDHYQSATKWDTVADSEKYAKLIEKNRIFQFLQGLNSGFEFPKVQLLGRDTLPSLDEVYSMLSDESRRTFLPALVFMSDRSAMVVQTPRTTSNLFPSLHSQSPKFQSISALTKRSPV
ncbi:hypothetical protein GIB67_004659 [Kingdonia uniflora]|uniref:Uncharacterized protein n=1 Tax=Kingdonia uniflora TaxID=39325 RepID=A0A7J7P4U3_9MAGN|nr:hypothetical protein GIB67_004659 [Kingdonia uniflora]